MSEQKKDSGWKRAYLLLRWPVALGLLGFSAIFFLVGLLNSLGYNGTTALRPIDKNSSDWKIFLQSFPTSEKDPHVGAPFVWKDDIKPMDKGDNLVNFDKRLVRAFEYLKNANNKNPQICGWSGQHELINIDVGASNEWSEYSVPEDKSTPLSTIYRGVGARIFQADYIKCVEFQNPVSLSAGGVCSEAPTPRKWPENSPGFAIPLASNNPIDSTLPYDKANCLVQCAIDFYPPVLGDPVESNPPTYNPQIVQLAGFDPKVTIFPYESIGDMTKKAGLLKTLLLAFEMMHIDDKGCESAGGNTGFNRIIPISMIMPSWVEDSLGAGWSQLIDMAQKEFPFGFQQSSKLAGLAADPILSRLGIHLNY